MPPSELLRINPADRRGRDQPRPALGLRPWFALLRRARSLRRFALAIRPRRVTADEPSWPIFLIAVVGDEAGWCVSLPRRLVDRAAGIRAISSDHGVLLAGSMVNGWGMGRPLPVLALDRCGTVIATHLLQPGRAWRHADASWMLELPTTATMAAVGTPVRLLVSPHGRDGIDCNGETHLVWNAHWQHGRYLAAPGGSAPLS